MSSFTITRSARTLAEMFEASKGGESIFRPTWNGTVDVPVGTTTKMRVVTLNETIGSDQELVQMVSRSEGVQAEWWHLLETAIAHPHLLDTSLLVATRALLVGTHNQTGFACWGKHINGKTNPRRREFPHHFSTEGFDRGFPRGTRLLIVVPHT